MGISLAPQVEEEKPDPLAPPKPKPVVAPVAAGAAPLALAPQAAPQAPGKAGGAPAMTPPMTAPMSAPAPTVAAPSAPVDRVKLATDTFNNLSGQRNATYQADSRDNIRNSAALGQIASGGLRTREGNLQLARERDLDTLQKDLTLKATEGSIADAQTAYGQALSGAQQGLAEKIGLAGIDTQKGSLALEKEKFATGANQNQQQIDLAKKTAEIEAAFKAGSLTLAQKDQALRELQSQQSFGLETEKFGLAKEGQAANIAADQQRIQLAKDQIAQTGAQFGASLAQQKELATLADATQNRQIDVSTAQGKNSLLLELARIMGAKDLSSIPPEFLASIAQALGVAVTSTKPPVTTTSTPTYTKPTDYTKPPGEEISDTYKVPA